MAVQAFDNLQLVQEVARLGYIDRIAGNFDLTGAGSNDAIYMEQKFIEGLISGDISFDDLGDTNERRVPTTQNDQTAIQWSQDVLYRVKRFRKHKLVDTTREALLQSRDTDTRWASRTVGKYAFDDMRHSTETAIGGLLTTIEGYTDSNSQNALVLDKKDETLKLSSIMALLSMYDDTGVEPACILAHKDVRLELKELGLDSKFESVAGNILDGGAQKTFGVPAVYVSDSRLKASDIDTDASGNQAGYKILVLPKRAVDFALDRATQHDVFKITGKDNLAWGIQGEYGYTFGMRGWSWTSTTTNPDKTALETFANWTPKYTANLANLNGFMLKIRKKASATL